MALRWFPSSSSHGYTQVQQNQKCRHSGRDCRNPVHAGKSVISAGMPKSRPWTVISRFFKCLIQETCQTVVSLPWIQRHLLCPRVCHPWTLDFGIHAEMTGFDLLVYKGESRSLATRRKSILSQKPTITISASFFGGRA